MENIITSKSNPKIIEAKKLIEKKAREKTGLFLVETKKVILEALQSGLNPKCFFVLENKCQINNTKTIDITKNSNFTFLNDIYCPKYVLTNSVFKEISTLTSPDGIIAIFEKPKNEKKYGGGNFLILDCLQNPDNMGAIFRSALASNFCQIYCINSVDVFSPKVIRSSMGNQFRLNIQNINYEDIDKMFSNAQIFVADMNGKNIFEFEHFEKNTGIVVGNEGNGISEKMKSIVKKSISIPMQNNVESLNASVSASILMYQIYSKK